MASEKKIKAGEAYVEATLNDGPLKRKMRETRRFFERRFPRATRAATKAVQAFAKASAVAMTIATGGVAALVAGIAALGAAATGGVIYGLKRLVDVSGDLADAADRTATSTQALQELHHAAEMTGAGVDAMNSALYRMRRRVANATQGTGPAVRALRDLGLSAEALSAMSPDKQMETIAEAMKGVADESLAAQYAFEIFGDGAKALMPLLSQGAEGIAKLRQEARDMGLIIDPEDIESANNLSDAIGRIRKMLDAIMIKIGATVAPIFERIAQAIQDNLIPAMAKIEAFFEDLEQNIRGLLDNPDKWGEVFQRYWDIFKEYGLSAVNEILAALLKGIAAAVRALAQSQWNPVTRDQMETAANRIEGAALDFQLEALKRRRAGRDAVDRDVFPESPRSPVEAPRPSPGGSGLPSAPVEAPRPTPVIPPSVSSAGTFSARAASFLGRKDPVVTELKDANKTLNNIERNTREGSGITFA